MTSADALYAELKSEIGEIANELFRLSELLLKKQGNFSPHAAVLTEEGDVRLVAADPGGFIDLVNSTEVLPLLYAGLRQQARSSPLKAIGVAENVTVTLEGEKSTSAIKVLLEHRRGLTVALYAPFERKFLRGYVLAPVFSKLAEPEVNAWAEGVA